MARIKSFSGLFFIVLVICMCGCKKTEVPDMDTSSAIDTTVVITEKGIPFGDIVTSTIGPDGGTISAADRGATLVIPRGALSANTSISIQAVTNTFPTGVGDHAYQFLPEGLVFAIPASLTLVYDTAENQGVSSAGLVIANQQSDGSWMHDAEVKADENRFTLTGDMEHFSTWTIAKVARIFPRKSTVELGGTVYFVLQVMKNFVPDRTPGIKRKKEVIIYQQFDEWSKEIGAVYNISGWRLNYNNAPGLPKDGILKVQNSNRYAEYTSPTGLSPVRNPVVIQAVISNNANKPNIIADAVVFVRKNGYLKVTIGSQVFNYVQHIGEPSISNGLVNASVLPLVGGSKLVINAFDAVNGSGGGMYFFAKKGTNKIIFSRDSEFVGFRTSSTQSWGQEYYTRENGNGTTRCNEYGPKYSEILCTLTEFTGEIDGWISGTATGILYNDTETNRRACQNSDAKTIKFEFVLKSGY